MNSRVFQIGILLAMTATNSHAQEALSDDKYVPREEYEQLKEQFDALKAEVDKLKTTGQPQKPRPDDTVKTPTTEYQLTEQERRSRDQVISDIVENWQLNQASLADSSKFLIAGYATAGFTDQEGEDSNFSAKLVPVFLWKLNDRLLFEGEVEFELENVNGASETEVNLEYANVSYLLNDYITLGAGKFLTPFGLFGERLHPAWINKLPDAPLPYGSGGLAPMSSVGFYMRGGVAVEETKFNYAFYVSNGPNLNTATATKAGTLIFDNYEDINNNKAIGGRVGVLPVPEMELGYSFQVARVAPDGFERVDAVIMGVDFSYVRYIDALGGIVDFRAEWVFSDVENATFDPAGSLGFGPLTFDNKRHGGYVQLAYRPSKNSSEILRRLEFVTRWDMIELPSGAPDETDEQRLTFGLNYWLAPSTVVKAAYRLGNKENNAEDQNAFFLQAAVGF